MAVLAVALLGALGCKSAEQSKEGDDEKPTRTEPRRVGLDLAPTNEEARSIQIYADASEDELPIMDLKGIRKITIEFDLLTDRGRPLSVYFYHANRSWRRDLAPVEYLDTFQRDDLFDYKNSLSTQVHYVHYTYSFPNRSIKFLVSGNYVVRVTEQGNEDAVLFERPFYITEQVAAVQMTTDRVLVAGTGYPSTQPLVQFRPPQELQGNAFDYATCFIRNGRLKMARCSDRPSLADLPTMQFYLEPGASFQPIPADFFLDLGLLNAGNKILRVDRTTDPFEVVLDPDYGQFGGDTFSPLRNGQPRISGGVRGVADPDLDAEYVSVQFQFVPPRQQSLGRMVIIAGSFNDWQIDAGYALAWNAVEKRYEGSILLKQGQYEYSYFIPGSRVRRAFSNGALRAQNVYTALIYYNDVSRSTDRLVAVQQTVAD